MLKIRFLRTGKKHQPYFKIVVTDKNNPPRGGNFKDEVGYFNPRSKEVHLDEDKIKQWLNQGAQPSGRVHNLLVQEEIIEAEKKAVHSFQGEQEREKERKQEQQKEVEEPEEKQEENKKQKEEDEEKPEPQEVKENK